LLPLLLLLLLLLLVLLLLLQNGLMCALRREPRAGAQQ
jgi:hypothetical protein